MESQETREKCICFFRALPCIFMAGSWSDLCLGAWRRPFFLPAFKPIPKTRGVGFFFIRLSLCKTSWRNICQNRK